MLDNPLYEQLVNQVLTNNPQLSPYAELFKQMANNQEEPVDTARITELENKVRRLNAIARNFKDERDDALDLLARVAKALGACDECWGVNGRCPCCRGKGAPGFFQPEKNDFNTLVLPALKEISWLEIREKQ